MPTTSVGGGGDGDGAPLYAVVPTPQCGGLGLRALRRIPVGTDVLREAPIATLTSSALQDAVRSDPELSRLVAARSAASAHSAAPWSDEQWWPAAVPASTQVIVRFAELEFAKLSDDKKARWMALADSFSPVDEAKKSPGNVIRSNAYTDPATGDNHLFELMSRANHSCAPNVRRSFYGAVAVVSTLCDVEAGTDLCISYLSDRDLARPTHERRALLRDKFNFVCECERCGRLDAPLFGAQHGDGHGHVPSSPRQPSSSPPPPPPQRAVAREAVTITNDSRMRVLTQRLVSGAARLEAASTRSTTQPVSSKPALAALTRLQASAEELHHLCAGVAGWRADGGVAGSTYR